MASSIRPSLAIRSLVVLLAVVAAYNYSLLTLLRGLAVDTPLAYLGMVPVISLLLVIARIVAHPPEPDIHDRYVDYIVGVPILLMALVVIVLLPVPLSTFYWLWRLDLLSLPLFAAGIISIVFGIRAVWRLKTALAFLLLAWPIPYLFGISSWMERFTAFTAAAIKHVVAIIPLARPVDSDGSYFAITHAGHAFAVGVSSACSGANGLVGFILIGAAFLAVVRGSWLPKLIWLSSGLLLIWLLNVLRILLIFAAGNIWGESVAIDGLHPFIGLVTFNLGVLAMVLTMPYFHLPMGMPGRLRLPHVADVRAALAWSRATRPAVGRAGVAVGIVVAATLLAAPANSSMRRFEMLAYDLGPPRLAQIDDNNARIAGWSLAPTANYSWASQYFGQGASWNRYAYAWDQVSGSSADFRSATPVTMDVIQTQDLHTFSEFGVQACFFFHNYRQLDEQRVDLGGGLTGHAIDYYIPDYQERWSAVYWEWPVDQGGKRQYERVILNRLDTGNDSPVAPLQQQDPSQAIGLAINNAVSVPYARIPDASAARPVSFLVSFGRQIVLTAASHSPAAAQAAR